MRRRPGIDAQSEWTAVDDGAAALSGCWAGAGLKARPSIHPLIHSFIDPLIPSFIHPFIHSSVHPFIHSFIHPSIHSFIHEASGTRRAAIDGQQ